MKLEMTLPERPGLLHAVPVLDIFGLLALLFLMGPSLVRQTGVTVDLPPSQFQLERFRQTLVVTLGRGETGPRIHFGRHLVTREELAGQLDGIASTEGAADAIVLLQTDVGTPVGTERDITELILEKGFRVALVGSNTPGTPAEPAPAE